MYLHRGTRTLRDGAIYVARVLSSNGCEWALELLEPTHMERGLRPELIKLRRPSTNELFPHIALTNTEGGFQSPLVRFCHHVCGC